MGEIIGLMARLHVLAAEAAPEPPGIAKVDYRHAIWTWLIFGVVCWVLWKWAWKPLREQLEARESRIRDTVDKAHELKQEAEVLLDKHRELMDRAKADAQEVVADGRAAAEKIQAEAADVGKAEAKEIVERARREIELETKKALDEIRREAVDLTLLAASRVIDRSLTDEDHRRLTSRVIDELDRLPGEG